MTPAGFPLLTRAVRRVAVLAVTLALALSACGGGEEAQTDTDTGTGTGTATNTGTATGVAAAEKECAPVGEELESEADATVEVALADYAFEPSEITVDAGVITFATTNTGAEAHELAFLPGGGDVPFTDDGVPDEEALTEAGAFELEAYGPGQSCNATYELEPGTYTLFCIVASPDGQTHYEQGMRGTLTVR